MKNYWYSQLFPSGMRKEWERIARLAALLCLQKRMSERDRRGGGGEGDSVQPYYSKVIM